MNIVPPPDKFIPPNPELTALELMGAFFTSQIHDLNNQMTCLCNAQLLLETASEPLPEAIDVIIKGLHQSIHRLSESLARFNTVRRGLSLPKTRMSVTEVMSVLELALEKHPGWTLQAPPSERRLVCADPRWLGYIIRETVESSIVDTGKVILSASTLPPRLYAQTTTQPEAAYLLIHFECPEGFHCANAPSAKGLQHEIAMELIRLMGAMVSLERSDRPYDLLLGLKLVG